MEKQSWKNLTRHAVGNVSDPGRYNLGFQRARHGIGHLIRADAFQPGHLERKKPYPRYGQDSVLYCYYCLFRNRCGSVDVG